MSFFLGTQFCGPEFTVHHEPMRGTTVDRENSTSSLLRDILETALDRM